MTKPNSLTIITITGESSLMALNRSFFAWAYRKQSDAYDTPRYKKDSRT